MESQCILAYAVSLSSGTSKHDEYKSSYNMTEISKDSDICLMYDDENRY